MRNKISPWKWVPTLYLAEGLPYVAVMTMAVIMYKDLQMSNAQLAFYTGWLYLPWVIKPFWSPLVDLIKAKRWWIIITQFILGVAFAGVAFSLYFPFYIQATLAFFWLLAFSSATHDIAADGFYMLGLNESQQAFYVGIRNTFYRIAMILGQGAFVIIAGLIEQKTENIHLAWSVVFGLLSLLFVVFSVYHSFLLPQPNSDINRKIEVRSVLRDFIRTFTSFFNKPGIMVTLIFMLTFRLAEAQLVKLVVPFLRDDVMLGGLGLSTAEVGTIYGTVGMVCLTIGGVLGGLAIAWKGFRYWIIPMVLALNLPNLAYLYLSLVQPEEIWQVYLCVALEQFGYGFGTTAFAIYLISFAEGENKTSYYAICTGFMALGMMLPGMVAGWIQEQLGYTLFFSWIMICTTPGFLILPFLHINPEYGKRSLG